MVIPDLIRDPCWTTTTVRAEPVEAFASLRFGGSSNKPGFAPAGEALWLCFAKEKYPKERRPDGLGPSASLQATCGARQKRGLAKLACGSNNASPLLPALLGPARGVGETNAGSDAGSPDARSASGRRQVAVMFARDSSTRCQMRLPAIAQRGRGWGGSGELRLLSSADHRRSVMQPKSHRQSPEFKRRLANHFGQQVFLGLQLAQPARVVVRQLDTAAQQVDAAAGAQGSGM